MKEQDQIKAIAELDGWTIRQDDDDPTFWLINPQGRLECGDVEFNKLEHWMHKLPKYLTSRDAIVPVIEKWIDNSSSRTTAFIDALCWVCLAVRCSPTKTRISYNFLWILLRATPPQLCEALLRATRKWKD